MCDDGCWVEILKTFNVRNYTQHRLSISSIHQVLLYCLDYWPQNLRLSSVMFRRGGFLNGWIEVRVDSAELIPQFSHFQPTYATLCPTNAGQHIIGNTFSSMKGVLSVLVTLLTIGSVGPLRSFCCHLEFFWPVANWVPYLYTYCVQIFLYTISNCIATIFNIYIIIIFRLFLLLIPLWDIKK
jgi:hypothetical protein